MKLISFKQQGQQGQLYIICCLCCLGCLFSSCSESDDTNDEFANWKERNETFVASLANDSLHSPNSQYQWKRLKSYSLDETTEGQPGDYIYVKILKNGDTDGDSPMFTDSVRVSYQGRLIPTENYQQGFVFDGKPSSDPSVFSTSKFALTASGYENVITGWITALMHMHRGDYWRIYIPYQLGYGETDKSSSGIPAYSTLIFDINLVDFSPAGKPMPVWSARQSMPIAEDCVK